MNVTLVMVVSADGKSTKRNEDAQGWSSPEDAAHFRKLKRAHRVLVMGRHTYEAVRDTLKLSTRLRRIVLTDSPEAYAPQAVTGKLEFSNERPVSLVTRLTREGYTDMLLAGGSTVNAAFLAERLITQCYLTVEPRFFGSGNPIFGNISTDVRLRLVSARKINRQGTLVLHYTISYDHQTR